MGQSERSLSTLKALGRRVAELQDQSPAAQLDRARGRARLLAAELSGERVEPELQTSGHRWTLRPRAPFRIAASLAAAALLLVAIAVVLVVRPRDALRFELGATQSGVVGEWIAAPPAADLPIRFSDGSWLRLAPGGRARVGSVDANGAEIALERGALDLTIIHRERTRWRVRVGPFQVHVIGTRFETSWDPVTEQFGVALHEGAITVSGPVVGEARAVRAGERLTISAAKGTLEVGSIDGATAPTAAPPPMGAPTPGTPTPGALSPIPTAGEGGSAPPTPRPPEVEPPAARGQGGASGSAAPRPAPREAPGWRSLARDARYKDALAAAELEGFDALCGAAGASDLHALGDAARLGGSSARAGQAFTALRKRFPGSAEAASSAFILGRIAQDQSKNYAGAAGWFTRYLSEQPGGEFAADAAGRLVEAEDKMGDDAGARRAAERYLAAYPDGSHAGYAKSVLARGAIPAPRPTAPAPNPPTP